MHTLPGHSDTQPQSAHGRLLRTHSLTLAALPQPGPEALQGAACPWPGSGQGWGWAVAPGPRQGCCLSVPLCLSSPWERNQSACHRTNPDVLRPTFEHRLEAAPACGSAQSRAQGSRGGLSWEPSGQRRRQGVTQSKSLTGGGASGKKSAAVSPNQKFSRFDENLQAQ